jgi:uncharacterized protein YjiK
MVSINCGSREKVKNNKEDKNKNSSVISDSLSSFRKYDLAIKDPTILRLPNELKEISGITSTPDGRLFAHHDESGKIYEINKADGSIVKRFAMGKPAVRGDFEDIAYASGFFYLVDSKGDIFEFSESEDGKYSEFTKYETPLTSSYDVEGLCYDDETNSLLLACKGFSGEQSSLDKAVYSFSLKDKELSGKPRFMISNSQSGKSFNPSGISKNPVTGSFYIISATGNSITEISKDGTFLGKIELSGKIHEQPEGITFLPDNSLLISNEGKSGKGYIVIYPYEK